MNIQKVATALQLLSLLVIGVYGGWQVALGVFFLAFSHYLEKH